jgi:hypothetical protein
LTSGGGAVDAMRITVKCYSGYRADERPTSIHFGELSVKVVEIVDQWLDYDHRYVKIIGDDGGTYIIRQDTDTMDWELTLYRHRSAGHRFPEAQPDRHRPKDSGADT